MQLTITLADAESADLTSIAEKRLQTPEDTARDLLVDAIAANLPASANARNRSFNRGVMTERSKAVFSDAFVRSSKQLNAPSYPVSRHQ